MHICTGIMLGDSTRVRSCTVKLHDNFGEDSVISLIFRHKKTKNVQKWSVLSIKAYINWNSEENRSSPRPLE